MESLNGASTVVVIRLLVIYVLVGEAASGGVVQGRRCSASCSKRRSWKYKICIERMRLALRTVVVHEIMGK